MNAMLAVADLEQGFGANQVLHGVCLNVAAGRTGVLLGLNGAGKSVTLRTVMGLHEAWGGSVRLAGRELLGLDPEDRVRAGLALVPQTKGVFPRLTVEDNLRLGGATVKDRARYRANLDKVFAVYPRLAERRTQLAGSLSGGEQAMLAVSRALMTDPQVLLLDEPSAGLAPKMVHGLLETIGQVKALGTTMLVVEQNVGFGLALADEAFILEKGRVVYHEPTDRLDASRVAALLGIGSLLTADELLGQYGAPPPVPAAGPAARRRLELSARVADALHAAGLRGAKALCARSRADLLRLPGIGPAAVREIEAGLRALGMRLSD